MARSARAVLFLGVALLLLAAPARATIFGNVRGHVRDPQGRAVEGATVLLQAQASAWTRQMQTDPHGRFEAPAVPVGQYVVTVVKQGFETLTRAAQVDSGTALDLTFTLALASVTQSVTVSAAPPAIDRESSTTQTLVSRRAIADAPGADRANSLAMITDYVPGAYMVHDQLHVRGGHQVTWQIDGVPVPNTNIASNVGPQFDPQDVDYLEVQRGGYSAEYGDRTYGVFNVVPRSGFEAKNFVDLSASYGSFNQTNDYAGYGSHTERLGWFLSANANRSDYGLETPTSQVLHDRVSGFGGFSSILFNATPADQLRVVVSSRADHYQVPNDPMQQAAGVADEEREQDSFVNVSWVHTAASGLLLTVSPFYHFNRAHYIGGAHDTPIVPEDDRGSQYIGGQVTAAYVRGRHNASVGAQVFGQRDNTLFALTATDGSGLALSQRVQEWGTVSAVFAEERYRATSWLTLNGGLRYTHYSGGVTEDATSPRVGAAAVLPRVGWVLRAFYGRYYQAPPLNTVSGPLLAFALDRGFDFLPLQGERDEQWEVGLAIPLRRWTLDLDHFQTNARNFFDHDVLGNSNIFFPLTIARARIRGWEATLRAPRALHGRLGVHLAFSNQTVQGAGAVTGGLTDFSPPDEGYFYLDHDQRNTLNAGFDADLPARVRLSSNVMYGSGFLNGDGPGHLPAHATVDVQLARPLGAGLSLQVSALNLGDVRYLLDNSSTFGGTHFNEPRQFIVGLRYSRRP
ncbi:MAG: TonB-dependent receptor [Acidobacteriota bacterium]|nr:TonB-dependent receptor [Acidobacteriota bacterium]